ERERQFINIYRSQDKARELSDEGFNRVLEFTRQAFNLSLHFIGEQEDALQTMLEAQEAQLDVLKNKISRKSKRTDPRKKSEDAETPPDVTAGLSRQNTNQSKPEST